MGIVQDIWFEQQRNPLQVLSATRCIHRSADTLPVLKGCLRCPGNHVGHLCYSPELLSHRRWRLPDNPYNHICMVSPPPGIRNAVIEEGLQVCETCKFRQMFELPANPTWAVGVTTAPRDQSTVERSVSSLRAAGWDDITVFAEPDSRVNGVQAKVVQRETRFGAWSNWFDALEQLTTQDTDVVMLCQDDVVYTQGVRRWLENNWPKGAEIVSPYTCPRYPDTKPFYLHSSPRGFVGSLCMAMSRNTAMRILETQSLKDNERQKNFDALLGVWCHKQGIPIHCVNPSLAQHIGATSSMHDPSPRPQRGINPLFPGENHNPNRENYIVTCFSVNREDSNQVISAEWLHYRLSIFFRFYVPSVQNLGVKSLILCSKETAPTVRSELKHLPWAEVVESKDKYEWYDGSPGTYTRLDSDDAINRHWFSHLPRTFQGVCCSKNAFMLECDTGRVFAKSVVPSAVATFMDEHPYKYQQDEFTSKFKANWMTLIPVLHVVHGNNICNRISPSEVTRSKTEVDPAVVLPQFGLNPV